MNARATFTRMEESTKEDWGVIVPEAMKMAKSLPDRVLAHLRLLVVRSIKTNTYQVHIKSHRGQTCSSGTPQVLR